MSKVFFISDTHFNHSVMTHEKYRPFETIDEHDEVLIANWNSVVSKDDTVYHLGDFAFCDKNKTAEFLSRLNGKIHLILGNHDTRKLTQYIAMGFASVNTWAVYKDMHLSHKPLEIGCEITMFNKHSTNIHGHIHAGLHRSDSMNIINKKPNQYFCVSVEQIGYTPIEYVELCERMTTKILSRTK